jgi:hypothetical protein
LEWSINCLFKEYDSVGGSTVFGGLSPKLKVGGIKSLLRLLNSVSYKARMRMQSVSTGGESNSHAASTDCDEH